MSAPARPPFYYEPLSNGEVGMDPAQASGWLVDDLVSTAETFREWLLEAGGYTIDLAVLEHETGRRAVIGWRTAPADGTLVLTADPSGWVKVVGTISGREVFSAYLDRPWEHYEFWPEGARPQRDEEAPGQMGKKQAWVGLRAETWPSLLPIADSFGGVYLAIDDKRLSARMDIEGR
ncbi:MAG TPA: hypothetical protein PK286_03405 [Devosia sp.]|nr:hypothetical protein [Devosia sp.]